MLSVEQTESIILNSIKPIIDTETVDLSHSLNRILANSINSKLDFPYWDNSAMDGYAVKFSDVQNCDSNHPIKLKIVEEIPAGYIPKFEVKSGETSRIFTGAMLPHGADTIIMQENTVKEGDFVKILASPKPKEFVRKQGTFYQAGNNLLSQGTKINAPEISILATAQCTRLNVFRQPKVAFFSTGDELITPDQNLQLGQIIDSNQYLLSSFIIQNNAIPINMGIVSDQKEELKTTIKKAINQADFVLSTGGVSVGDYDYVEQVLSELGGKIHITSVKIKPGKPLTFATFNNGCIYFGIPGNPVSAMVTCERFIKPALQKISGLTNINYPIFINAKTRDDLHSNGKRETYLWGNLYLINGKYEFELATGIQNSANLINLAQINAFAIIPVGEKSISANSKVKTMQIYPPYTS